jgi:hypothetical protein
MIYSLFWRLFPLKTGLFYMVTTFGVTGDFLEEMTKIAK